MQLSTVNCTVEIHDLIIGTDAALYRFLRVSMIIVQVNLDMTDSMGPGKLVRHMQNPSYTYDEYLICIRLGPNISSVICKDPSYSGPSYPSSHVFIFFIVSLFCDMSVIQNGSFLYS